MDAESDLIRDYSIATRDHSHEDIAADLRKQSGYQHMDARSLQNTVFMADCDDGVRSECSNWNRFGDPKPYQCYMCDGKFPDLEGFEDHLVIHASQILFAKQDAEIAQITRKRWQQSDSASVTKVNRQSRAVSGALPRDRAGTSSLPYQSGNDDDSVINLSTRRDGGVGGNVSNVVKKSFACRTCGKKFAESSRLERHLLIHSTPATYSCNVCGKSFLRPNSLRAHAICHSDARPHVCDICDRAFARAGDMRQHRATHIGLKPHACPECGKTFARQNHVNTHLRVHRSSSKLLIRTPAEVSNGHTFPSPAEDQLPPAVDGTVDGAFKCVECSGTFTSAGELDAHKCTDGTERKNFSYDVCERQFSSSGILEKHLLEHTGGKPFPCQYCNKSFASKQKLEIHERCSHTIDRPYVCCECDKAFLSANKLLIHFNKHR